MKIYLIKYDGVMHTRSSTESIGVAVTSVEEYEKFKNTNFFKDKGYKITGEYAYEIIEVLDTADQVVNFLNGTS